MARPKHAVILSPFALRECQKLASQTGMSIDEAATHLITTASLSMLLPSTASTYPSTASTIPGTGSTPNRVLAVPTQNTPGTASTNTDSPQYSQYSTSNGSDRLQQLAGALDRLDEIDFGATED